ncbi:MAG: DUF1992 domain-containing protein [Acidobacteriota bacterium]
MTQRKPAGQSIESFAEHQIREGQAGGLFANLEGKGKPIPGIDAPHDDLWWVKNLARREGLKAESPALSLRKEVEIELEKLPSLSCEDLVRERLEALNDKIRHANRTNTSGAPTTLAPFDVEKRIALWREQREQG